MLVKKRRITYDPPQLEKKPYILQVKMNDMLGPKLKAIAGDLGFKTLSALIRYIIEGFIKDYRRMKKEKHIEEV